MAATEYTAVEWARNGRGVRRHLVAVVNLQFRQKKTTVPMISEAACHIFHSVREIDMMRVKDEWDRRDPYFNATAVHRPGPRCAP